MSRHSRETTGARSTRMPSSNEPANVMLQHRLRVEQLKPLHLMTPDALSTSLLTGVAVLTRGEVVLRCQEEEQFELSYQLARSWLEVIFNTDLDSKRIHRLRELERLLGRNGRGVEFVPLEVERPICAELCSALPTWNIMTEAKARFLHVLLVDPTGCGQELKLRLPRKKQPITVQPPRHSSETVASMQELLESILAPYPSIV